MQTSEAAVQPRRSLLRLMGFWAAGLFGSSLLAMAGEKKKKMLPPPAPKCAIPGNNNDKDNEHHLAKIIGALCVSRTLRESFFAPSGVAHAKEVLHGNGLLKKDNNGHYMAKQDVICAIDKIYNAHQSPDNYVQGACENLSAALQNSGAMPCPDWPC